MLETAASASTEAYFRWKFPDCLCWRYYILWTEDVNESNWNWPGTLLNEDYIWWSCAGCQGRQAINSSIQLECLQTTNIPKPVRYTARYIGDAYNLAAPNFAHLNFGPIKQELILDWNYKCCQIPEAGCAI